MLEMDGANAMWISLRAYQQLAERAIISDMLANVEQLQQLRPNFGISLIRLDNKDVFYFLLIRYRKTWDLTIERIVRSASLTNKEAPLARKNSQIITIFHYFTKYQSSTKQSTKQRPYNSYSPQDAKNGVK